MRTLASGTRLFVPSLVMVLAWRLFVSGERAQVRAGAGHHRRPLPGRDHHRSPSLTCLYTAVGGIKAVIWTDVIQAA